MASCQSCGSVAVGRRGCWVAVHQSVNASSDRKNSMRRHVNTMSVHHVATGTTQWKSQRRRRRSGRGEIQDKGVRGSARNGRAHDRSRPARRRHRTRPRRSLRGTWFRSPSPGVASERRKTVGPSVWTRNRHPGTSIRLADRRRYPSLTCSLVAPIASRIASSVGD